jgi:anti-sigma factor RsiW
MSERALSCREFIEFIMDYLDGALPSAESAAFEVHLGICPDCVHYLESYRETSRLSTEALRDPDAAAPEDVPEDLVRAILEIGSRRARGSSDPVE